MGHCCAFGSLWGRLTDQAKPPQRFRSCSSVPVATIAEFLVSAARPLSFLALFTALFVTGKEMDRWVGFYDVDRQIERFGNTALAIPVSGYYLGIIIIFLGAMAGPSGDLVADLISTGTYAAGGTLLLLLQRPLASALILPGVSVSEELIEKQNRAVGAVLMGAYLAAALIVAGCTHGKHARPEVIFGFYVLGQVGLVVFTWLYERATPFVLRGHLEEGNLAVGIGLSGTLVAIGLLMMNAALVPFSGWLSSLWRLGQNLLVVLVHLAGLRLFFHAEFLPIGELYLQLTRDENLAAGLMQFVVSVGFAAVLIAVL